MRTQIADPRPPIELLWGANEMAAEIGRTPRQVHNLLVKRILPAKKVGGKWCITRQALVAFFCVDAA